MSLLCPEGSVRAIEPVMPRKNGSRASLVMLSDNARPPFVRQVVERALQLVLHHRMLFFHDEDFLEAICEFAEQDFISRPRHPNLQHRDPEISAHLTV